MVNSWEELSEQSFVSVTIATSTLYCRIACCRAPMLLLRLINMNALVTSSRRCLESIIGHERTGHSAGVAAHHAGRHALHPVTANLVTVRQKNVCACVGGGGGL